MTRRLDPPTAAALSAALVAACGCFAGCASMDRTKWGLDEPRVQTLADASATTTEPKKSYWRGLGKKQAASPYLRPTVPPEGRRAYDAAAALYAAGKLEEAEKAAKKVAKNYADTVLEEDALFLTAESQFAQKKFAAAQDSYSELFERFPSTRHLDASTGRMFEIARNWLRFPAVVTAGDVTPVNFDKPADTPPPRPKGEPEQPFELTRAIPILPNLTDKTRPAFDTEGRALEALKSIWLHDPTGPLADDALMMSASYHLRRGDFLEADRFYKILRDEYPKSPHLEDAFVLGSHVKLMSYQGDAYDGGALEQARGLKEDTLKLFPRTAERDRLLDELRKTEEAKAARQWGIVGYYRKKGKDRSVAVACHSLVTEFPNSRQAGEARRLYASLPAPAKAHLPPLPNVPARTAPPNLEPVPYGNTGGGNRTAGGETPAPPASAPAASAPAASGPPASAPAGRVRL